MTEVVLGLQRTRALGASDCEDIGGGLLAQPVATLSSLAYVAAGWWLVLRYRTLPVEQRRVGSLYACLLMLCGVGSVAYHGPQSSLAGPLHDVPIVLLLGMAVLTPLVRLVRGRRVLGPGGTRHVMVLLGALLVGSGAAYLAGRTGGALCDPTSLVQAHALWHVGTAVALALWGTVLWPSSSGAGGRRDRVRG